MDQPGAPRALVRGDNHRRLSVREGGPRRVEAVWSFPPRRKTRDNSDAQFASQAFDKSRRLADPAPPVLPESTGSWSQRARPLLTRRQLSSGVREKGKGRWARQAPSTYGHLNQTPSLARGAWPTQLIRTGSHTLNNSCCHPSWRRITIPLQSGKVCADRDSRSARLSRRAGGETKHNKNCERGSVRRYPIERAQRR